MQSHHYVSSACIRTWTYAICAPKIVNTLQTIHISTRFTSPSLYGKRSQRESASQSAQNVEWDSQWNKWKSHFQFRSSRTTSLQLHLSSLILPIRQKIFPGRTELQSYTILVCVPGCPVRCADAALRAIFPANETDWSGHFAYSSSVRGRYKLYAVCTHALTAAWSFEVTSGVELLTPQYCFSGYLAEYVCVYTSSHR